MRSSTLLLALVASGYALELPFTSLKRGLASLFPRKNGNKCPPAWTTVSQDLTKMFLTNGQCNDDARAAIRAAFHDCGTWNKAQGAKGGCDGSLILAQEYNRAENNGLQAISAKLLDLSKTRSVGVADMIAFAGAHAIVTCPSGPQVKTYIGRKDSSTPAPDGLLPDVNASGDSLFALFQDKGFDAVDLAALVGAHTTSKQFFVDQAQAGKPQDSTPGVWDVKFYGETLAEPPPPGNFRFASDLALSKQVQVGKEFKGFVDNQGKWSGKFADAMSRMLLLGVPGGADALTDCTDALPRSTGKKRDIKSAPMFKPRS
ncbi:heme peroxidase [Trichodelitschia bisporula]|uniref:Peroxidase n=1 Tax=Trichodelitschia bisporula TaxID=703511 RepID=A0A6G1I6P6_9PEZI|nr:heme peroxidase [Trichodelitschia bisporula]